MLLLPRYWSRRHAGRPYGDSTTTERRRGHGRSPARDGPGARPVASGDDDCLTAPLRPEVSDAPHPRLLGNAGDVDATAAGARATSRRAGADVARAFRRPWVCRRVACDACGDGRFAGARHGLGRLRAGSPRRQLARWLARARARGAWPGALDDRAGACRRVEPRRAGTQATSAHV